MIGAHLVGSITSLLDEAPYPDYKDVDVLLIFEDGSPALQPANPFEANLELSVGGLMLEGGLKPKSGYASAEAVLTNPEIAYHLTRDSILYDPQGFLCGLQPAVQQEYPRRPWVKARCAFERYGLDGVLDMLPAVQQQPNSAVWGYMLLGYTTTFLTALMCIATLQAPTTGSSSHIKLQSILAEYNSYDLYEALVRLLGLSAITPEQASHLLAEATTAFDAAVQVKKTPMPFGHKIRAHLRPYFVGSCQAMLEDGFYREAGIWSTPFYIASCNTMLADGPDDMKPVYAQKLDAFMRTYGMAALDSDALWAQAASLYDDYFALADQIVDGNPAIVD